MDDEEKPKKDKHVHIRMEEELYQQAEEYARQRNLTLSGIMRAFLRILTDPQDPREPPPGAAEESKRPPGPGRGNKKPRPPRE